MRLPSHVAATLVVAALGEATSVLYPSGSGLISRNSSATLSTGGVSVVSTTTSQSSPTTVPATTSSTSSSNLSNTQSQSFLSNSTTPLSTLSSTASNATQTAPLSSSTTTSLGTSTAGTSSASTSSSTLNGTLSQSSSLTSTTSSSTLSSTASNTTQITSLPSSTTGASSDTSPVGTSSSTLDSTLSQSSSFTSTTSSSTLSSTASNTNRTISPPSSTTGTSSGTSSTGTSSGTSSTGTSSGTSSIGTSSSTSSTGTSSTTSQATTSAPVIVTVTSASTASITGVSSNTHISTTDSSGHHTVVPVLFGCSFCGGGGIELFGGFGPGPGTYEWPPVPQFSGLPPISIDAQGDPSEETKSPTSTPSASSTSTSSSSSSSTCTQTSTASRDIVSCTVMTVSGQSSASTTCATKTSPITGCDITATATTTTVTSSATCWQYTPVPITPNDDPSEADDTTLASDDSVKRSIAGRLVYEEDSNTESYESNTTELLVRRGVGQITSLGACTISTTLNNGAKISYPNWPKPGPFQSQKNLDTQKFWWLVDGTTCPDVAQLKWNGGQKLSKSVATSGKQSADHVFEKGLVTAYLNSLLSNADSNTCNAFNQIFVQTPDGTWASNGPPANQQGNPNVQGQSRLQSLYNVLPNQLNLAFVGVDQGVNSIKGKFFNEKLDGFPNIASTSSDADTLTNLNIWNEMGMAIDFLKQNIVQQTYQVGNAAMLGALNQFDNLWSGCGQNQALNFGDNFQTYMSNLLKTNLPSMVATASAVSNSLVANAVTTDGNGNKNAYYTAISNLAKTYPPAQMTFPTGAFLNFPATTDQNIKRDGAACTLSATSTGTNSATTTSGGSSSTDQSTTSMSTTSGPSSTSQTSSSATESSTSSTPSTTSTSSNTPTTSASPTPTPTPLTEQARVCNNEADYPGHGDIDGFSQAQFSTEFCEAAERKSALLSPDGVTGMTKTYSDEHGINYSYIVQWIPGCITTVSQINVTWPAGDDSDSCSLLLADNWYDCSNGGVGGSTQVGCVNYIFDGALGKAPDCDGCTTL